MVETLTSNRNPVRVKVCGLTSVAEALECARAGVDWIGLNFHPHSSRRVELSVAAEIVEALPPSCEPVGLFVDRPPDEVGKICARLKLSIVQLHGNEPPEDLKKLGHLRLIRAFRLGHSDGVNRMIAYLQRAAELGRSPDAVLIDAYVTGQPGGTGHVIAEDVLSLLPPLPCLILAGGLTPENVAERVERVRPWMVDVASGVESSPGSKDARKVTEFISRATGRKSS